MLHMHGWKLNTAIGLRSGSGRGSGTRRQSKTTFRQTSVPGHWSWLFATYCRARTAPWTSLWPSLVAELHHRSSDSLLSSHRGWASGIWHLERHLLCFLCREVTTCGFANWAAVQCHDLLALHKLRMSALGCLEANVLALVHWWAYLVIIARWLASFHNKLRYMRGPDQIVRCLKSPS